MRRPKLLPAVQQYVQLIIDNRRARTPHVVGFQGLLRSQMHELNYLSKIGDHHQWIDANCKHEFMPDDLFDESGNLIGRAYRFADLVEATWFKLSN